MWFATILPHFVTGCLFTFLIVLNSLCLYLTWFFRRFKSIPRYFLHLISITPVSWFFPSPYCMLHLILLCCLFIISLTSKTGAPPGSVLRLLILSHHSFCYLLSCCLYADNFKFTINLIYLSAYLTFWLRYLLGISNLVCPKLDSWFFFSPKPALPLSSSSQ